MTRLFVVQHIDREGPDLFAKFACEHGIELIITRLDRGESLPTPTKRDGLLILGGPMGIGDIGDPLYPWLKQEVLLIQNALSDQIPLIGVCLGAQLLAHASGGGVERLNAGRPPVPLAEVGWSPIHFAKELVDEPIYSYFNSPLDVLHWHGDRIVLPEVATPLASSSRCAEQMFRIGNCAYGLQFHAEVELANYQRWIEEDAEFIRLALGDQASDVLAQQFQLYGDKSRPDRLRLLEGLFELLYLPLLK